jgi:hypothetical protein
MMDLLFVGIGWTDLALALNRIAVGASRECRMSQLIESGPSRALAGEALLLGEFSHRVGNEFAAAVGVNIIGRGVWQQGLSRFVCRLVSC